MLILQHQLELQLSRPFKMQHLTIRRSPATICLWCLSAKDDLLHLHGRLLGLLKLNPTLNY